MWPKTQPTLTAGGITLRPVRLADADRIVAGCSDPAIAHFTRVPVPYGREDAEQFVRLAGQQWAAHAAAVFAIADADDLLVGTCALMDVEHAHARAEAGYWVSPDARGRGVARTALSLLTDWGHSTLGLREIFLTIEDANPASVKAALASGYDPDEATLEYELKGTARRVRHYWHRSA